MGQQSCPFLIFQSSVLLQRVTLNSALEASVVHPLQQNQIYLLCPGTQYPHTGHQSCGIFALTSIKQFTILIVLIILGMLIKRTRQETVRDDGIMKYNKMGLFFLIKRAFLSLVTPKQSDSLSLLNIHLFFFLFQLICSEMLS